MKIKLIKAATIHGIKSRANSVHEVIDHVALKLISRGYAEIYVEPEEAEDGDTSDE
jgi:hypothetical protein